MRIAPSSSATISAPTAAARCSPGPPMPPTSARCDFDQVSPCSRSAFKRALTWRQLVFQETNVDGCPSPDSPGFRNGECIPTREGSSTIKCEGDNVWGVAILILCLMGEDSFPPPVARPPKGGGLIPPHSPHNRHAIITAGGVRLLRQGPRTGRTPRAATSCWTRTSRRSTRS